jgi:hypothetical protein
MSRSFCRRREYLSKFGSLNETTPAARRNSASLADFITSVTLT